VLLHIYTIADDVEKSLDADDGVYQENIRNITQRMQINNDGQSTATTANNIMSRLGALRHTILTDMRNCEDTHDNTTVKRSYCWLVIKFVPPPLGAD